MSPTRWARRPDPPSAAELSDDAVDVWRVEHDQPPELRERLEAYLTAEERERAERFIVEHARLAFSVTRATLRCLLAAYLTTSETSVAPDAISFETGQHGKPHLAGQEGDPHFNVSHSGGLSLLAFSRRGPLGVDVEHAERDPTNLPNVAGFFAAEEQRALERCEGAEHREAFFRCWTRKEAYMKATGAGMSVELDAFSVSLDPDEPRLIRVDEDDADAWRFVDLDPGQAYAGALCVRGSGEVEVRAFDADRPFFERLLRCERF